MHPSRSQSPRLWWALVAWFQFFGPEWAAASRPQQPVTDHDEPRALVLPTRREPDAPPEGPRELPPGADRVIPVTVEALIRREPLVGRAQSARQTITRSAERVHIASSDGSEWLFQRNVRDPRRVFGSLVNHVSRAVVVYDESDLRTALGLRGWASVLTMGFDPESLTGLRRSGESRTLGGVTFSQYVSDREDASTREVWWSDDQIFPSDFVAADATGTTRFSVESVRLGADEALLQAPASRFPAYRVFELADWLEGH